MGKEIREGELGWIALLGTVLMLAFLALTGVLAGQYIGGKFFGREDIGIIIGAVLGMAIGFYDIIRVAIRVMRRADRIALEKREERELAEAEELAKLEAEMAEKNDAGENGGEKEIEKERENEDINEEDKESGDDDIIIM